VSKSAIDEAHAKAEANQAKYNAIVARLRDRLVVAPFDGVLGFRQISPGALVSTGTVITTIDDVHRVKADFSIPEKFFSQFKVGDTVRALSDAYPGELFFGEVTSIGSRVDPVTRSVTVRARIENADRRLRPGMLVKIRIFAQRLPKVLVPEAGVILDGEGAFVYVIESGESGPKAVSRRIVIEKRIPGSVVVSSGVNEGETVVALGTMALRSGSGVKILSETTIPPLPDAVRAVTSPDEAPDEAVPETSDAGSEGI
jgi:membrane fusion protein (multidrug efflux system)